MFCHQLLLPLVVIIIRTLKVKIAIQLLLSFVLISNDVIFPIGLLASYCSFLFIYS